MLVSRNVICFGYVMPISQCVNNMALPAHSMHLDLNRPRKKHHPSSLRSPLLNLQTVQAPLFRKFTLNLLVFHASPLKIGFFSELL